jgi:riboflavin kinase/FMN adenylyltransferase
MKLLTDLSTSLHLDKPACALTIGNYDGVHVGHQAVLKRLCAIANQAQGASAVLSFENHPSLILKSSQQSLRLCTSSHRFKLLESIGIDVLFSLPFSFEFSQQTAEEFLCKVRQAFPFTHLILGYDGVFGKNREGNPQKIQELSKKYHFLYEYIPETRIDNTPLSSSIIRHHLAGGELKQVEKLLNRPYSIVSHVIPGAGRGKSIGYPTANIEVDGLCLPPLGVYAVRVLIGEVWHQGIANLGVAPTIRQDLKPLLEVHLFDYDLSLYGCEIEVVFEKYVRAEMIFSSVDMLKAQIALDIRVVKKII